MLHNKGFYLLDTSGGVMNPPHPGSIIRMDGTDKSRAAINGLLRKNSPNSSYLTIFVYPDSFDCFHILRDCAIALDFQYEIIATDHFQWSFGSSGSRGSVQ